MNSAGDFQSTHWSQVMAAARNHPGSELALTRLFENYWLPLYSFARRTGQNPHAAQDLTQGFFLSLLENDTLSRADQSRGRFRSFLLSCFKNFISREQEKATAQKRGGGKILLSLDQHEAEQEYQLEPANLLTPDKLYERKWARGVIDRVLRQLEHECNDGGRGNRFDALKNYIIGEPTADSYAVVAKKLGVSEGTVKSSIHRLRQRYVDLFRAEIATTVDSPSEVDDEIRYLCRVLGE